MSIVIIKMKTYLSLFRMINSLALALLFTGSTLFFEHSFSSYTLLGASAWLCVAAFSYGFNDVYDVKIDLINHPKRPLPSQTMSVNAARLGLSIAASFSILLTVSAERAVGLWPLIGLAGAIAYSVLIRQHSAFMSNITAAALVTLVVISAESHPFAFLEMILNISIFFMILMRELQKDVLDALGDAASRPVSILKRFPRLMWPIYRILAANTAILLLVFCLKSYRNGFFVTLLLSCVGILGIMTALSQPSKAQFQVIAGKAIAYLLVIGLFAGSLR